MRITTKGRYGVRAVVTLAGGQGQGPVSISRIAREEGVSPEFLEQIFFRLKKSGLIQSMRGPKGGFMLSRDASDISLRDILVAVDETLSPAPCADMTEEGTCARQKNCPAHPMWKELSGMIDSYFSRVTVQDLLEGKTSFAAETPASRSRAAPRAG